MLLSLSGVSHFLKFDAGETEATSDEREKE